MYSKSSNLIGLLPLNNFLYSTPTTAHAHMERISLETAVAEWLGTLVIGRGEHLSRGFESWPSPTGFFFFFFFFFHQSSFFPSL